MQGEIRVTVIATGFDRAVQPTTTAAPEAVPAPVKTGAPVIPFPAQRPVRPVNTTQRFAPTNDGARQVPVPPRPAAPERGGQDLSDMEIPTFIRRQMD
jgi:cell division protein FtsZ